MDSHKTEESPKRRAVTILAGGCLVVLYLALFVILTVFIHEQTVIKNSPTPTATAIPTPHIVVHQPTSKRGVVHEDFSSNRREWGLYYPYGKLEVINGKLILQSNIQGGPAIGTSNLFAPSGGRYYIQADFTTDTNKALPYGLVFGLNKSLGTYYLFEIWPRTGGFRLLKYNAGKWHELIPYSRGVISPYPEASTLSVYFNEGHIELYINGELASTFSDTDLLRSTDVGIFVSNSGYRLIVDDFFVYAEK